MRSCTFPDPKKKDDGKAASAAPSGASSTAASSAAPMEGVETTTPKGTTRSSTAECPAHHHLLVCVSFSPSVVVAGAEFDISGGLTTGMYEMFGVVTHKGRSADSGHYVVRCSVSASG
jgi:hypothetical protein